MTNKTMLKGLSFIIAAAFFIFLNTDKADAQIFQQDFSSSNVVSDYVSATPNSGQFNAISTSGAGTTVSINNGSLQFARGTANAGSFSRTTDISAVSTAIIYKIDITVSGNTAAATTAATFQVGSGFGTANTTESNANTYARFAINLTATAGTFQIRDITNATNSANFSGTQTITWVLNNTGATLNYTAPDGTTQSVANDTADLYVGTTLAFNDVAIQTPTQTITDLKFVFSGGTGTINLDNLSITSLAPTAASVNVGGRVTQTNGRGIFRARVTLTDGSGEVRTAYTNPQGFYRFEDVPAGATYIFNVSSKRFIFPSGNQVVNLNDDAQINFVGEDSGL